MPEDEFTEDEQQEQETDEQEDPLAGIPDATRAAVEALIAEREQAAQAAAEAKFNEDRSKRDARLNKRLANLSQIGVAFGDDDSVAFTDPAKLGQVALGFVGQQAPKPEKPAPAAVTLDWSAENIDQQIADLVDQRANSRLEALLDEKFAPLLKDLAAVRGMASRPILDRVGDLARDQLDASGVGQLADHEYFEEALKQQIKEQLPENQWNDPAAVGSVAAAVGMALAARFPDQKTQRTRNTRDADLANLHRSGLGATGASRGGGRNDDRNAEASERVAFAEFKQANPESANISIGQFRMLLNGGDYGDFAAAGRKNGNGR